MFNKFYKIMLVLICFLVPVFFLTLTDEVFFLNKILLLNLLLAIVYSGWIVEIIVGVAYMRPLRVNSLSFLLILFILLLAVSTVFSFNPLISYNYFLYSLSLFLFFFFVSNKFELKDIDLAAKALFASAAAISLYGALQFTGIDFIYWEPREMAGLRPIGTIGNPIFLGGFLAIIAPIAAFYYLKCRGTPWRAPTVYLFIFIISYFVLCLTFCRSAILAFALAMIALFLGMRNYNKAQRNAGARRAVPLRKFLILFLIIIIIPFSMRFLPQKDKINKLVEEKIKPVMRSSDINISARLYLWKTALYLIEESPVTGHGAEVFSYIYTKYRYMEPVSMRGEFRVPGNVHNQFLEYAVTGGVPVLAVFIMIIICFFYYCVKLCGSAAQENKNISIILFVGALSYLTMIFFAFNNICLDILWYLFLGFCAADLNDNASYKNISHKNVETARRAVSTETDRKFNHIIIIFLFFISVFAAYHSAASWAADYHYKKGSSEKANKNYAAALREFNKSIAANPLNPSYLRQKGKMLQSVFEATGNPDFMTESERAYRGALAINASSSYLWADLATLKHASGNAREAIECYRKALDVDPYNAGFAADLATEYFNSGQADSAEKYYLNSLAIYPYSPMTNTNLANLYCARGDLLKARIYTRRALQINPDYLPAIELLKKTSRIKK